MNTILYIILFSIFLSCQKTTPQKGDKNNPLIFTLNPSEDSSESLHNARPIQKFLEGELSRKLLGKETGFHVKVMIPTSYIASLEAFGSKRNDFGVVSTLNFLIAKDRKNLPVKVLMVGTGKRENNDSYFSQIITRTDSGINHLSDLQNKSFAFTDPASTSGHIIPRAFLKKRDIKFKNSFFASRHDAVATMVYQGKVDAGATYHIPPHKGKARDARSRILTQFPDAIEKIKILAVTDPIPNSPWMIRTNIYNNPEKQKLLEDSIFSALKKYIQTKAGKIAFTKLNNIQNFKTMTDKEYRMRLQVFDLDSIEEVK